MTGIVDEYGRALVRISVRHPQDSAHGEWDAWIDTGFSGHLILTQEQAEALNLPIHTAVRGALGDGSATEFETRHCIVEWFDVSRPILALITPAGLP